MGARPVHFVFSILRSRCTWANRITVSLSICSYRVLICSVAAIAHSLDWRYYVSLHTVWIRSIFQHVQILMSRSRRRNQRNAEKENFVFCRITFSFSLISKGDEKNSTVYTLFLFYNLRANIFCVNTFTGYTYVHSSNILHVSLFFWNRVEQEEKMENEQEKTT